MGDSSNQLACRGVGESEMLSSLEKQEARLWEFVVKAENAQRGGLCK